MNKHVEKFSRMVWNLMNRKFWGKLELTFRNGEIVFVRREETSRFDEAPVDVKGLDTEREI